MELVDFLIYYLAAYMPPPTELFKSFTYYPATNISLLWNFCFLYAITTNMSLLWSYFLFSLAANYILNENRIMLSVIYTTCEGLQSFYFYTHKILMQ